MAKNGKLSRTVRLHDRTIRSRQETIRKCVALLDQEIIEAIDAGDGTDNLEEIKWRLSILLPNGETSPSQPTGGRPSRHRPASTA